MIKILSAANNNPAGNRTLQEFHEYWARHHGPLFCHTPELRRYVQHLTLPEAYGHDPKPTHDGASMFWFDDVASLRAPFGGASPKLSEIVRDEKSDTYKWYVATKRYGDPDVMTLSETVRADDNQLFDRAPTWPRHRKRTSIVAEERIVIDGPTRPDMVKAIWAASRLPGLNRGELFEHWFEVHGALAKKVPGARRYVQNHAIPEAELVRPMTHDGWSEMWFDDLESLAKAQASAEWQALRQDGVTLFAQPMAVVVAKELVQKG